MSTNVSDSDQSASERFAARRREARKRIYGAPIDWAKADAEELAKRRAEAILREALASGPRAVSALQRLAAKNAITWTQFRQAQDRLGIEVVKNHKGLWEWRFPATRAASRARPKPKARPKAKAKRARRDDAEALRDIGLLPPTARDYRKILRRQ